MDKNATKGQTMSKRRGRNPQFLVIPGVKGQGTHDEAWGQYADYLGSSGLPKTPFEQECHDHADGVLDDTGHVVV